MKTAYIIDEGYKKPSYICTCCGGKLRYNARKCPGCGCKIRNEDDIMKSRDPEEMANYVRISLISKIARLMDHLEELNG